MTQPPPGKWVSASGKVHRRRLRFWPGTEYETQTPPGLVVTLCGRRREAGGRLDGAPSGAVVDCGVCLKSQNTKGHLRR